VEDRDIERLFAGLGGFRHLVLAVSGGADSMALMILVSRWLAFAGRRRPMAEVVTVDHGLRANSAEEAHWVGERASALGFKHTTLAWTGEKPKSGLQEAAREARYRLLSEHALRARARPVAVVTAHTEDDQAETLLMRLARGSGLDGLSAMRPRRPLTETGDVEIVRPLLGLGRDRLVATLKAEGADWVEDPSNACLDFERARLRAARSDLATLGLTNDKLALSVRRLARARTALERAAAQLGAEAVDPHDGMFATINRTRFLAAAPELQVRLLTDVLKAFGGEARPPRLAKIEALAEALAGRDRITLTLGGCIIAADPREIRVFRELDPGAIARIELEPGTSAIWDRRFRVSLASARSLARAGIHPPVTVRALGSNAYATLRRRLVRDGRPPALGASRLPSFWAGEDLIAVPQLSHLGAAGESFGHELCKAEFIGWRPQGMGPDAAAS
jgi:tRNA(Ile)-lysidine synthase